MDILLAFPQLILALAIASILGPAVPNVVIAISIPVIPRVARVVRAAAMSVKENVYVEAVQALGATRRRVILQHIIPNVAAPYIIMLTAQLGAAILAEAALSYLGLGAAEPTPSWGLMLSGSAPSYASTSSATRSGTRSTRSSGRASAGQRPSNRGGRFSLNALTPSAWSAVCRTIDMCDETRSRCVRRSSRRL